MANLTLIIGKSGSGKSTSIRNLDPKQTFIINVCKKELPFRGARKNYNEISKENPKGNMLSSDNYDHITPLLHNVIDKERKEIKCVIIDDSQYLIVNEFMKKHSSEGKGNQVFSLYNTLADNFWKLIFNSKFLRNDLHVFFLHHCENDETGMIKVKTIGRMLDEKIDIPGLFTVVLYTVREGTENFFITQNDGSSPAKSPDGMFNDLKIPNDLKNVIDKINNYYEGD